MEATAIGSWNGIIPSSHPGFSHLCLKVIMFKLKKWGQEFFASKMVWKITFCLPKFPHFVCRAQRCLLPLFWNLLGTLRRCHALWSTWSLQGMGSWAHSPAPSQWQGLGHLAAWPVHLELEPGHYFWILRLKGFHLMNLMGYLGHLGQR